METADYVLAVVNKHVPRAFGQAMIHSSKIDYFVQDDTPLMEAHFSEPNETETAIGKHCAALIEDGATLQMGIGAIPNAVLAQLGGHKNLASIPRCSPDGVLPLVESGVINGEAKNIDKGKMVSTFLMGSQRVYDFIDDNPAVLMMDVGYTNDPYIISKNDRRDGHQLGPAGRHHGAGMRRLAGHEVLFGRRRPDRLRIRRIALEGRQSIIAMPSVTNKGISKIAPVLTPGAGVVTTRNHIHWFVTEHGAVDLYGKTLQERARLIISVADPSAQEELDRDHSGIPHGGFVIRTGTTGADTKQMIEYSLKLGSNPEFTSSVIVAYARAAYKMAQEGITGAKTVFDVAPAYLSALSGEELRKHLL